MTQATPVVHPPGAHGQRVAEAFQQFTTWSPAKKTVAVGAISLLGHLLYLVPFKLLAAEIASLDVQLMEQFLWLWILTLIVLTGIAAVYWQRDSSSLSPLYIFFYVYALWISAFNYGLGVMDSVYAAFILVGVVIWALVAGWRTTAAFVLLWAMTTGLLVLAQCKGWIAYAPFYVDRSFDARNDPGATAAAYFWSLEAIGVIAAYLWILHTSRDYALRTVEHSRNLIRSYLPPSVAERILAGKEAEVQTPQRRRVTVLFADIAGFTSMADRVEPEVVTEIVDGYLSAMSDLIEQHGGTLNEFAGDGMMALFGAPEVLPTEEQAQRAIRAAAAMQQAMPALNERWRKLGIGEPLGLRIGINTGVLSVGSFGSKGRMTYTAVGLQTNVAARIQAQCPPGSVLISDSSWQLVREHTECAPKGELEVKGVHFPIKVYAAPVEVS